MTELKTLLDLWNENGQKPFDAVHESGFQVHIVALAPDGHALGWRLDTMYAGFWSATHALWRLAPKAKRRLYPAIYAYAGGVAVSGNLYETVEAARTGLGSTVRRLATEYPAVEVDAP